MVVSGWFDGGGQGGKGGQGGGWSEGRGGGRGRGQRGNPFGGAYYQRTNQYYS